MDIQEKGFIDKIKMIVKKDPEVYNVHDIIMKNSGDKIFLTFHIRVESEMTIRASHVIVDRLMEELKDNFNEIEDVLIHVDPLRH